jgi:hypothetical protein
LQFNISNKRGTPFSFIVDRETSQDENRENKKKRNSFFSYSKNDHAGGGHDSTRRADGTSVRSVSMSPGCCTPSNLFSDGLENRTVLPKNHTESLIARIKTLVSFWAFEEIMNGNQVFCKYWVTSFSFIPLKSPHPDFYCRLEYHE